MSGELLRVSAGEDREGCRRGGIVTIVSGRWFPFDLVLQCQARDFNEVFLCTTVPSSLTSGQQMSARLRLLALQESVDD